MKKKLTKYLFFSPLNKNICSGPSITKIINKTRPTYRRTDANLYPQERQLTKASEPSFDLEGGAQGQI